MAVLAHPDDESFAIGGALAKYAGEGIDVHLVTATRGARGRYFDDEDRPGDEEVGAVREGELRRAAETLGLRDVHVLGYRDGELDRADTEEAVGRIVGHLRRVRPQVVVTFDPFGAYGHPDHVAVCELTTTAVAAAAAGRRPGAPHEVAKLYYAIMDDARWTALQDAFAGLAERLARRERGVVCWPEWSHSARIDARGHEDTAWRALQCHRSQLAIFDGLDRLTKEQHESLWGRYAFYRALSTVPRPDEDPERDLFEGLRAPG